MITNSKLGSSSKILNENYNFIKKDVKLFLKTIDKNNTITKLASSLFEREKKDFKVLLAGEPILDYYSRVVMQGKSQKSSIVSATKIKTDKYGGGSILVVNLLSEVMDVINYLVNGNNKVKKILKSYLTNPNKINIITTKDQSFQKFLIKERFIDKSIVMLEFFK